MLRIGAVALLVPLGITFEIVNNYFTKAVRYKKRKKEHEAMKERAKQACKKVSGNAKDDTTEEEFRAHFR